MATDEQPISRPSISSVDARVARLEEAQGRLEARQLEQDGVMKLIQLEQTHIREIMTSRFVSLEGTLQSHGSKLDNFIGKMETLIAEGMKQGMDLKASPLGRQVDERMQKTEQWVEISKEFHAEQRGQRKVITGLVGTNVLAFMAALFSLAKSLGWLG